MEPLIRLRSSLFDLMAPRKKIEVDVLVLKDILSILKLDLLFSIVFVCFERFSGYDYTSPCDMIVLVGIFIHIHIRIDIHRYIEKYICINT